MSVPTLDTHEFTRRADVADGRVPLVEMERLGSLLVARDGALEWHLAGRSEVGADGSRRAFLHLGLNGSVRMRCVRCLEPIDVALGLEHDYRLVATEEQAEQEDADEDEVDVLVASRRFDLAGLIEDEAIMGLPTAPRHEDCRAPAGAASGEPADEAGDAPPRRNPFAALGALRAAGSAGDVEDERGADPSDRPPRRGPKGSAGR